MKKKMTFTKPIIWETFFIAPFNQYNLQFLKIILKRNRIRNYYSNHVLNHIRVFFSSYLFAQIKKMKFPSKIWVVKWPNINNNKNRNNKTWYRCWWMLVNLKSIITDHSLVTIVIWRGKTTKTKASYIIDKIKKKTRKKSRS